MGGGGAEKSAAPAAEEPAAPTAATADEAPAASKDEKPQFRALYSYAGQHDDELPFNAGDIISLISKEEEAWWKGELDGRIGVFPSNYVEEINCKQTFYPFSNLFSNPLFFRYFNFLDFPHYLHVYRLGLSHGVF
jgi:hypothetical protein